MATYVQEVRLYPNHLQAAILQRYLDGARRVYNQFLEAWNYQRQEENRTPSYYDGTSLLVAWRKQDPALAAIPSEVGRDAIRRVVSAGQRYCQRLRAGQGHAGPPRFKSRWRYRSFTVGNSARLVVNGRIQVPGIKSLLRCRNLRPIEGS